MLVPKEIRPYSTLGGKIPFKEWMAKIKDRRTRQIILSRLTSLRSGHYGNCRHLGEGMLELKIHFGPGYRVYFIEVKNTIIVLLLGGDKSSQSKDIELARNYSKDYLRRFE